MILMREPNGEFVAPSRSEPGRNYRITLAPARCSCRGFSVHRSCRHLDAAVEYDHTYQTRLALLSCLAEPTHLQHTLATEEAQQTINRL